MSARGAVGSRALRAMRRSIKDLHESALRLAELERGVPYYSDARQHERLTQRTWDRISDAAAAFDAAHARTRGPSTRAA